MKIFLIRHGKTKGNLEKRYIGTTDEPLCEEGITEIREKRSEHWYPIKIERLAVSPLLRCRQTASIIFPDVEDCCIVQDFRETDFGKFENKNYMELSDDPDYIEWLQSNGTLPFPEGESRESFNKRCITAFGDLYEKWSQQEIDTGAIVAHGGTIMAILSSLIPSDFYKWQARNGEGFILTIEKNSVSAVPLCADFETKM